MEKVKEIIIAVGRRLIFRFSKAKPLFSVKTVVMRKNVLEPKILMTQYNGRLAALWVVLKLDVSME